MGSSKSFDRSAPATPSRYVPTFSDRGRLRGYRGGVIAMHRALARFVLEPLDLVTAALLVLMFSFAWIVSLPRLCRLWAYVLGNGMAILGLHATLGLTEHHITPYIYFSVPYPRLEGIPPDPRTWWSTAVVVCLAYAATYFFPGRATPVKYLLRAVLLIQFSALLYFLFVGASYPHTPDSYMEGLVSYKIALISFIPALFGLTYYIFIFSAFKKIVLTILAMSHLSVFLPLHILLQAMILEKSVVFMPVLYIVFGLPLDIVIILAFYSWGMSWVSNANIQSA